jgi:hypothetical protein
MWELPVLCAGGAIYAYLNYVTNLHAMHKPFVHDFVFLYSPYAWIFVHAILISAIIGCVYSQPDAKLLARRLMVGYSLKAITQRVTVVPQPEMAGGAEACRGVPWWYFKGCADMMFSGHTMITMLLLYKYKYRGFAVFTMAFELVFAKWHYMSDCIMAVLAATAIESWVTV